MGVDDLSYRIRHGSVAGNLIFKMFGITLASLRITGAIVVFVTGYNMLQGSGAAVHPPGS